MKPLEFKIEKIKDAKKTDIYTHRIVVYYEDGTNLSTPTAFLLAGFEVDKHYLINELYGYQVKDDREGL